MKFLLAVDGSECSSRAANHLIGHLSLFRELPQILLVTVHAPIPSPRARAWVGKEVVEKYYDEENEEALAPAKAILTAKGIPFTAMKRVGEAGEEIARYAESHDCDLIVMGTHGHGNVLNLIMGSVATKVLAATKLPVMLIK